MGDVEHDVDDAVGVKGHRDRDFADAGGLGGIRARPVDAGGSRTSGPQRRERRRLAMLVRRNARRERDLFMMSSESNGTRRERLRVCRKGAQEKENLRAPLEMK